MIQKHSHLLTLVLFFLSCTLASAHDFEAVNDDGVTIYYKELSDTECAVTYYGDEYDSATYSGSITIPASVSYYYGTTLSVTAINYGAFFGCRSLTDISLPSTITSIGDHAFESCTALSSITLPESLTSIGDNAFRNCTALTTISFSESLTSIGNYSFTSCESLISITLPNSLTSIGSSAFYG